MPVKDYIKAFIEQKLLGKNLSWKHAVEIWGKQAKPAKLKLNNHASVMQSLKIKEMQHPQKRRAYCFSLTADFFLPNRIWLEGRNAYCKTIKNEIILTNALWDVLKIL
jgi:hypothetical protein